MPYVAPPRGAHRRLAHRALSCNGTPGCDGSGMRHRSPGALPRSPRLTGWKAIAAWVAVPVDLAIAERLRFDVDLTGLGLALASTADEAVGPDGVGVWLRSREAS